MGKQGPLNSQLSGGPAAQRASDLSLVLYGTRSAQSRVVEFAEGKMSTVEQSYMQGEGGRTHAHTHFNWFPVFVLRCVKMLVLIILVLAVPALPRIACIAVVERCLKQVRMRCYPELLRDAANAPSFQCRSGYLGRSRRWSHGLLSSPSTATWSCGGYGSRAGGFYRILCSGHFWTFGVETKMLLIFRYLYAIHCYALSSSSLFVFET